MNKSILLVSGGEYGDMYSAALATALGEIAPGITVKTTNNGKKEEVGAIDCIVLMDGPSFDLPYLKRAKRSSSTVIYYGGAGDGTLKTSALKKASKFIDLALAQSPVESILFSNAGIKTEFAGHPLVDIMESPLSIREAKEAIGYDWTELPVTVVPGDGGEALHKVMFEGAAEAAAVSTRKVRLIVPDAERYSEELLNELTKISPKRIKILKGQRQAALRASEAAVTIAGPAALEAALGGAQVLTVKKGSLLSSVMDNLKGKGKFFSLPNIILGYPLGPELAHRDVTAKKITQELVGLVETSTKNEFEEGLAELRDKLGPPGSVKRAAEVICKVLE